MAAGHPSQADCRRAVRGVLPPVGVVLAAVSGGPDSLALAAALAAEASSATDLRAGAVVVDHGLQEDSAAVAQRAAAACRTLGLAPVTVVAADATPRPGESLETAARRARYAAIEAVADELGDGEPVTVLLGHTRDDQAEQVLLGLARGSGARSLSGMPAARTVRTARGEVRLVRPFLTLPRATTLAACDAWGLDPWHDPHNTDRRHARVRARAALAELEGVLGPGLADGLVRTADLLRADADLLDALTAAARAALPGALDDGGVDAGTLAPLEPALRRRVLRVLLLEAGCPPGSLAVVHVDRVDALLVGWCGQGPADLPGGVRVARVDGRLHALAGPGAPPAPPGAV